MSAYLWKYYFENDLEKFRQTLANATFGAASSSKGGYGGKGRTVGAVANSGGIVATSPIVTSKQKICPGSGLPCHPAGATSSRTTAIVNLTRADLNWKDANGITLLHSIASSNDADFASSFGMALLEAPALDLYVQDAESGWTALHRALYTGNISLARALINRDIQDTITPTSLNAGHIISNLIKVKDREGNSPFDVYGLSVANRMIRRASTTPLLSGSFEDEEDEMADGVAGDSDDAPDGQDLSPRVNIDGDELFMFGSNKNFTLGFGDEDDRKNPERIVLRRPDHLLQRFHSDRPSRQGALHVSEVPTRLPALIKHRPIKIQDVQLSKYHSAILTNDPEANLHVCGFGPGGRLGTGDETTRFQFVCVYGGGLLGKRIVHVALGQNHTIALSSQGEVFTWGSNSFGQLGYSFPSSQLPEEEPVQLLPRQVFGPMKRETVIGAAASRTHSVLHTLNSLYTFGKNDGQLGLVDSDARSLVQQNTPRKVAASLFTSSINAVSAIERATVCLLENHEVWVFANYGYTKVSFPSENFSATVVHQTYFGSRRYKAENQICKVTSGGDTICALSTMGDVFTVHVSQKMQSDVAATSSTTNPPKIRGALSAAQKVWSLRKDHMAVRDVAVGQDGSVVICTEAGSVWRRVRRAKVKNANAPGSIEYKPKDYKFSRVGGLTRINAVRSNAFGAYAAIRKDCDVLKTQIELSSKQLWKDLYPLLPFRNLVFEDENSDTEMPAPRFWVPNVSASDTATICRAVLTAPDLEERLVSVLKDEQASSRLPYDVSMKSATSDVIFPVHEFILGARSDVLRRGVATTRQQYYFAIPEVMTIEFDSQGKILISFLGADYITVLNLVLYMYTDVVVDVWRHGKGSPQLALGYRQIRLELMKLGSYLHMPGLEQAARIMMEPPKILDQDLERAIRNPDYFSTGDLEIELDGASVKVHSSLVCRRCPFFEALFHGRASGMWLASRREQVQASHEAMKVDLKHVSPLTFQLVLQYLYADVDEGLFDNVVTTDFDSFLDVIIDVMSLANELMLDRLQQCCQLLLGRFGISLDILVNYIRSSANIDSQYPKCLPAVDCGCPMLVDEF
jgi:alpha-tubulin suppressor-like RCC1 family protein